MSAPARPIPGLPFVDDAALELDDPAQIAGIGAGRRDPDMGGGYALIRGPHHGWAAFTTIPERPELAWIRECVTPYPA